MEMQWSFISKKILHINKIFIIQFTKNGTFNCFDEKAICCKEHQTILKTFT